MTTLSNFQTSHDARPDEASKETMLLIGAVTAMAVFAILIFAAAP